MELSIDQIKSLFTRQYQHFAESDSVAGAISLAAFERFEKMGFPTR